MIRRRPARLPAAVSAGLLLAAGLGACGDGGGEDAAPVSDSVYVEVMARLVLLDSALTPRLDRRVADLSARADSLRQRVLDAWGVESGQLLDYAETRGTSPGEMQKIWQRVYELSDSLDAAGWSPSGVPADSAPVAGDSARGA